MQQSVFVILDDKDDIRKSEYLHALYIGDNVTINGSLAAFQKLSNAASEIIAELEAEEVAAEAKSLGLD